MYTSKLNFINGTINPTHIPPSPLLAILHSMLFHTQSQHGMFSKQGHWSQFFFAQHHWLQLSEATNRWKKWIYKQSNWFKYETKHQPSVIIKIRSSNPVFSFRFFGKLCIQKVVFHSTKIRQSPNIMKEQNRKGQKDVKNMHPQDKHLIHLN